MSNTSSITVIKQPDADNPFVVISKPAGIASAPLHADDTESALSQAVQLYPQIQDVVNSHKSIEYGLLHRIDTATAGLLVIATTQQSYDSLQASQKQGDFVKEYTATCTTLRADDYDQHLVGFDSIGLIMQQELLEYKKITVQSYFRPYGIGRKQVRPVALDTTKKLKNKAVSPKEYTTDIRVTQIQGEQVSVVCSIKEGYRHQVRCHLAWLGLPICGDPLYNPTTTDSKFLFTASSVTFPHPVTGAQVSFTL